MNPVPPTADLPDELPQRRPGFWARFLRQRWALVGLTFLMLIILAAIFAPVVAPHPPNAQDINAINNGPSASHCMGSTQLPRLLPSASSHVAPVFRFFRSATS